MHKTEVWETHLDGYLDQGQDSYKLWETINGLSGKMSTERHLNNIKFDRTVQKTIKRIANS